jgi:FdhD protein
MEANRGKTTSSIMRFNSDAVTPCEDHLAVEEPLEIFLDGNPFYMTMRLPGDEIPLAIGYCFSEGIIEARDDILLINYCGEENGNRLYVTLDHQRKEGRPAEIKERRLPACSSCGLCGKELIADVCTNLRQRERTFELPVSRIDGLIDIVQKHQRNFAETGATHAAAAFDENLALMAFSEDIGRHNALDKVLGKLLLAGMIEKAMVFVITSRISYEVVQKTARTAAEILIGISSATSLAVELANEVHLTLVGFARNRQGNIYTMHERLISPAECCET